MSTSQQLKAPESKDASIPMFPASFKGYLSLLPYLCFIGFFLLHWLYICQWAVNIPFWDEWDEFPHYPLLPWIFEPHNEHRIVTTKLLALLLWKINGWDIAVHQILNFPIFGLTLCVLGRALKLSVRALPAGVIGLMMLYCLSPMANENHNWAYQTQWHFLLLFSFLGAHFWFSAPDGTQKLSRLMWGSFFFILAIYSLSAGLAVGATSILLLALFKFRRARGNPGAARQEIMQMIAAVAPVAAGIALHFLTLKPNPSALPKTLPTSPTFWAHFLSLVSTGDGQNFSRLGNEVIGALILCLIGGAWLGIYLTRRSGSRKVPSELWILGALTCGVLSSLFAISIGRASIWEFPSRYTEFSMMLIPFTLAAWWWLLSPMPKLRLGAFVVAGLVLTQCFVHTFPAFAYYRDAYSYRSSQISAMRVAYNTGQPFKVPTLYPVELPVSRLREAHDLHLSFMKQIE